MSARSPGARGRVQSAKKSGYVTSKYRTLRSAWTPMTFRPSNEQFDLWSDVQRKRFMTRILGKCSGMKILFNVKLEKEEVPIEHLDFTTVLPRFLSLYIMSLLDPKTLSRAAQVSWHWNSLAEQDCLWMPKCLAQGWYLPYFPSDLEHGAWKRHYVQCATCLDIDTVGEIPLPGEFISLAEQSIKESQGTIASASPQKAKVMTSDASQRMMSLRPRWMTSSKRPADIEWASKMYLAGTNVNRTEASRASVTFHDNFGTLRAKPLYNELNGQSAVIVAHGASEHSASVNKIRQILKDHVKEAARSKELLSECSVQRDRSLNDRMASLKAQSWLFTNEKSLPFRQ